MHYEAVQNICLEGALVSSLFHGSNDGFDNFWYDDIVNAIVHIIKVHTIDGDVEDVDINIIKKS